MYTYFNPTKQVLCAMQILQDSSSAKGTESSVFPHATTEAYNDYEDSVTEANG
jgi:hypothetical protein